MQDTVYCNILTEGKESSFCAANSQLGKIQQIAKNQKRGKKIVLLHSTQSAKYFFRTLVFSRYMHDTYMCEKIVKKTIISSFRQLKERKKYIFDLFHGQAFS
jgi:hypothetical protein